MLAGGGQCVADMAALRDQADLFGEVASAPTIWRAVSEVDDKVLDDLRRAWARARAKVWASGGAPEQVMRGQVLVDDLRSGWSQWIHFRGAVGHAAGLAALRSEIGRCRVPSRSSGDGARSPRA